MLNARANELVSEVAGQIRLLRLKPGSTAYVASASETFITQIDKLAYHRANSDSWKQAFDNLTELWDELSNKLAGQPPNQ